LPVVFQKSPKPNTQLSLQQQQCTGENYTTTYTCYSLTNTVNNWDSLEQTS